MEVYIKMFSTHTSAEERQAHLKRGLVEDTALVRE